MKNWLLLVIFVCAVVLPMLMLGGKSHRLFLVQLTRHCRRRIFIKVSWWRRELAAGDLDGRRRRTNIWDLWAQSFEDSAVMYVLHGRRPELRRRGETLVAQSTLRPRRQLRLTLPTVRLAHGVHSWTVCCSRRRRITCLLFLFVPARRFP